MKKTRPRASKPRARTRRSAKAALTPVKRRQLAAALHRSAPAHPPEIARPSAQPTDGEQALLAARLHQLAPDAPPATPRATPYRGG